MNNPIKISFSAILSISAIINLSSCKKNPTLPVLTTTIVSGITQTSAVSGGNISDDGGASIESRGICWSISNNPTTADNIIAEGSLGKKRIHSSAKEQNQNSSVIETDKDH